MDDCEDCCHRRFSEHNVDFFHWMWVNHTEELRKYIEEFKRG